MIDLKALWANHKPEVVGGAVAATAALAYIVKRRNAAAAASGSPTAASTTSTTAVPSGGDAYQSAGGGGGGGGYANLAAQLAALQASATATGSTVAAGAPNPFTPPSNVFLAGSGYGPTTGWTQQGGIPAGTTETVTSGPSPGEYEYINGAALTSLAGSGGTYYYQPQPGVFQQVSAGSQLANGTPAFTKVA